MIISLVLAVTYLTTSLLIQKLIPLLRKSGIEGPDMNKPDKPAVPEMGGLALVIGFATGLLFIIFLKTFTNAFPDTELTLLLGALLVVLMIGLIGVVDDLLEMSKILKLFLPIIGAMPLIALQIGHSAMSIPIVGQIDLGLMYALVVIPLGMTGMSNAFNMLGGFNGLEVGLGLVSMISLGAIAYLLNDATTFLILVVAAASLLAILRYNWYKATVFVGDTGTLLIGSIVATTIILGNFELAGLILIIPHFVDLCIKALNQFPSEGWWGDFRDGKLYCPAKPKTLCQWIMKMADGISERNLVLSLIAVEIILGAIAVFFFYGQRVGLIR